MMVPENVSNGVAVVKVENGSPADKAGIKKGDIITKLAGKDTKSLAEFRYELYKHSPNDSVEVTYIRDGKESTLDMKLIEKN